MGRYVPKTYKNHSMVRFIIKLILTVALVFFIIFITLFFSLKKYIVYRADGLKLEIPFLMEDAEKPSASPAESD